MDSNSEKVLSTQTFTYRLKTYDVDKIIKWGVTQPIKVIQTQGLLKVISQDSWGNPDEKPLSNLNHLLEDKKHYNRVMQANLAYPVILTNFHEIVDGVHRIFKAVYLGLPTINVCFISESILEDFLISGPSSHIIQQDSLVPHVPIPDRRLSIPKSSLPQNISERKGVIEKYFTEHLPTSFDKGEYWEILLERPSSPYGNYEYDSDLRKGLTWWEEGTRVRDIPIAHRFLTKGLLAIEDQWMPLSWSHCFSKLGYIPSELVLLHIDDHQDMMSPRLGQRLDGELVDYITGNEVSFLSTSTIKEAILSGAIGKGSIITPLAWVTEKIHIRHLSYRKNNNKFFHIKKINIEDEILSSLNNRIALHLENINADHLDLESNYVATNDVTEWVQNLPNNVPILVHIDMDYFNDRYDGNSHWQEENKRCHNPAFLEQQEKLNSIFDILSQKGISSKIIDFSIGISSGFFPSEFWEPMIETLLHHYKKLNF